MKVDLSQLSRFPAPARILSFILILLLLWAPFAIPAYLIIKDSNLVSIVTMLILYLEFLLLIRLWGQRVYHQPDLFQRYGLEFSRQSGWELAIGLAIGVTSLLLLFVVEAALGWLTWQPAPPQLLRIAAEGLLIALGVGFAEELVFRGWLLDELQRDYQFKFARWLNATLFALLHFIKPLSEVVRTFPQFPGLLLLGLTLIWAKQTRRKRWQRSPWSGPGKMLNGCLSLPIGLHGGLVWGYYIIKVGRLTQYTHRVPEWVTGLSGNPLSGVLGLIFLICLLLAMRQYARRSSLMAAR